MVDVSYREISQYFPRPGWVEHDYTDRDLGPRWLAHRRPRWPPASSADLGGPWRPSASPTSGRRWWPGTVRPEHQLHHGPSSGRTAARPGAASPADRGRPASPSVREKTGLVLDPYFSATKMSWLLTDGGVTDSPTLVLGTVDAWVIWNLTGGTEGGVLATDPSNASRTLLYDIETLALVARSWPPSSASPSRRTLPAVRPLVRTLRHRHRRPGRGRLAPGRGARERGGRGPAGRPVRSGLLRPGRRQGHLRHRQLRPGQRRSRSAPLRPRSEGLLTTVAWDLGLATAAPAPPGGLRPRGERSSSPGRPSSGCATASGLIAEAKDIGPLAASVDRHRGRRRPTWSRPSPGSAALGGIPTPGAPSSA